MATLYKLNEQFSRLLDTGDGNAVDTETGEVWTAEMLDALQLDRETKIENCLLAYKNYLSDAEQISLEIGRLAERRRTAQNAAERLKNYVADNLDGVKFSTPRVAVGWRRSESVEIDEGAALADVYTVTKLETKPDKAKIKEALKAGTDIAGCRLVVKNNIQVK